jgi:long-chain fatty acid transport protein
MQYITVNPIIAWKVHPTLSIAMGPTINYSKVEFTRGLASSTDLFRFSGDDTSFGFNAGLLWQPHPKWSFGANYRAASTMDYSGNSTYNPGVTIPPASTTASVDFPQIVSAGVSYRPTPKWNLEVDVDYTDWNTLNTVVLKGTSNLGFPIDLPLQFNWHESWFYEVGATRYFDNGWYASAGYFFSSETATSQYFTPAIPDTALHVGSIGVGRKGEHWRWAVAAQIITGPARDVNNSQPNPFTGESANGSYQLFVPTVSFSAGYQF